ncbi:hypothetical protein [Bradyrhizobium erythrophlei]|uniref:Uncharacterized protein n=1 Tax=Bradyrhizobium erythrophlei TaxID=1437360 RepID=A0A1M5NIA8_9BRAD|nr:hypothetical protein [Bradyrhizobium erythrophlei]SHG89306.1 hypothetical protein SAMN05443248_3009 [Bradyrhizobium erythrophlei]
MSRKQILKLIRQDELRRFREYVEDRPQPYTRYVVDQEFLTRRGLADHPRVNVQ